VVYLEWHRPVVTIGRHGEIGRSYGRGPFLVTTKYKNGSEAERIYDKQGLRSYTLYQPSDTAVTRYVRPDASHDPSVLSICDLPTRTPRLAGPKGPLPG
jgi:hypothetical protein